MAVIDSPRFDIEETKCVGRKIGSIGDENHLLRAYFKLRDEVSPYEYKRSATPWLDDVRVREMLAEDTEIRCGEGVEVGIPVGSDSVYKTSRFSGQNPITDGGARENKSISGPTSNVSNGRFAEILDGNAGLSG